jgi:hypothetical protein
VRLLTADAFYLVVLIHARIDPDTMSSAVSIEHASDMIRSVGLDPVNRE